ncbi:MAG: hypothetical protein CMH26_02680 [Micavibrio sp.]|nr:hypothetical protein [Micavibrio sp.]|tara:strand:- start:779 stop:1141 length:363 start_codon:yes stop_codon:yes gene_type:complete
MDVVVGIVKSSLGFIFMERHDGTPTFPSGKVEKGETLEDALIREIKEETDVTATITKKLGTKAGEGITLHFFACSTPEVEKINLNEPENFTSIKWASAEEIIHITNGRMSHFVKKHILEQ